MIVFREQLFEFEARDDKKEEDAYHFIAYIPYKGYIFFPFLVNKPIIFPFLGRLYELDGLKEVKIHKVKFKIIIFLLFFKAPIDHGAIPTGTEWTDTARPIVQQRMQK